MDAQLISAALLIMVPIVCIVAALMVLRAYKKTTKRIRGFHDEPISLRELSEELGLPDPDDLGCLWFVKSERNICGETTEGDDHYCSKHRDLSKVREDYQVFDMQKMKTWGNSAFWWPKSEAGKSACVFSSPQPRVGDVLTDRGTLYVITSAETKMDPGDQTFILVERLKVTHLPESTYKGTGLV